MDPDSSVDLKKHMFSIPGFFVAKGPPDSDAGRSPTSPLDLGVFGGLFSPRSSSPNRNKWVSAKVGLSALGDEGQSDSFTRDNIVLAPQIKFNVNATAMLSSELFDPCVQKSNSLPSNYASAVNIHPHTSPRRSSSSPMDIISTQAYSRSLSGREMALSEDYTCIISHGPNPKTTHLFGDCILDCDPKELAGLDTKEEIEKTQGHSLPTNSRLCLCTQDCHESHIHREVLSAAEMENENGGVEDSLDILPCNEDLFPMATHDEVVS